MTDTEQRIVEINRPMQVAIVYDQHEFEALGDGWTIIHSAQRGTMTVWLAVRPKGAKDGNLSTH